MSRGPATNVEFVISLMEHSHHGALIQAFVLQAIQTYAVSVSRRAPEELETPLIVGEAWHGCALEVLAKLDRYLRR